MYLHGDKETIDFTPLNMVTPSMEEEVDVKEDENGLKKDKWIDQMEDLEEDSSVVMEWRCNKLQQADHNPIGKKDWSIPTNVERRENDTERHETPQAPPPPAPPSQMIDYLLIGVA